MKCAHCHHFSKDDSPKFCSQCGKPMGSKVLMPKNSSGPEASTPKEVEMEAGGELKVEDLPPSIPASGGDRQGSPAESVSDASLAQQGSKKKKKRNRNKKKNKNSSDSTEPNSSSLSSSEPSSLSSLSSLGVPDAQGVPQDGPAPENGSTPPAPQVSAGSDGVQAGGDRIPEPSEPERQLEGPGPKESKGNEDSGIPAGPAGVGKEGDGPGGVREEGAPAERTEEADGNGDRGRPRDRERKEGGASPTPRVPEASQGDGSKQTSPPTKAASPPHQDPNPKGPPPKSKGVPPEEKKSNASKPQASAPEPKEAEAKNKPAKTRKGSLRETEGGIPQVTKPEGAPKNYAAAVASGSQKNAKEQQNKKASESALKMRPLSPGRGIQVFFHAIISRHFNFNFKQDKVFIRGGPALGREQWKENVCELNFSKDLGEHGFLIEGLCTISKDQLDQSIPYKYFLVCNAASEYEFIYKKKESFEHVNRCLFIKSSLVTAGEWHQYDDIICKKPEEGLFKKVKNLFSDEKKNVVKGKHIAGEIMLESIFSILSSWSPENVKSLFSQFSQFLFVVGRPMVYEKGAKFWSDLGFEEKEVKQMVWTYLKSLISPFLERNATDPLPDTLPVKSKLRMGLIILNLVKQFELLYSKEDMLKLCSLLCLDSMSQDTLQQELSLTREGFSGIPRMKESLKDLCRECISKEVHHWVWVLPVFHFFAEPFPGDQLPPNQPEESWAGLEGLHYRRPLGKKNELQHLMKRKKHLLKADQRLFRSWFFLLPLESLANYMTEFPANLRDCLVGTWYRLQKMTISYTNQETISDILIKLLDIMDSNQESILQEDLLMCSKLHEAVCKATKEFYLCMPALSAKIVARATRAAPSVEPGEVLENEPGKLSLVKEIFHRVLSDTLKWFQQWSRFCRLDSVCFKEELKGCSRFVSISFATEDLTEEWKRSFLGSLEERIKQERPVEQIKAYCRSHQDFQDLDSSINKCFETCAIEAVSSACQSQTNILDMVGSSNLGKFGSLVSAVIAKSWPSRNGNHVDELKEVLEHLLTWPDTQHLFNLYGTNQQILEKISEDAKKLLAVADSVFTKVVDDLLSGRILIRHLEQISEHKKKFQDMWELKQKSLSPQEKKHDLNKTLSRRENELEYIKMEKSYVECLLMMCQKVESIKVEFGDIKRIHSEDLGGKKLLDAVEVWLPDSPPPEKKKTHYNLSPDVLEMARKMKSLKDSHIFQMCWEQEAGSFAAGEEPEVITLELEDTCSALFLPCVSKFTLLHKDLKSGDLTLAEVDAVFKDFENKYADLTRDLRVMCQFDGSDRGDWIDPRVRQIREYHELHLAIDSAKVIAKVKDDLGLTGDFGVLQTLLNFTEELPAFGQEKLDRINKQLIHAKQLLQEINETRRRCLEEISLRKEFIGWVREALEDINELKVFVDLASISAGENDMDVDRVACFHDAVQGYGALLYKLEPGADFDQFMDCVKELWKALDNDQHLPEKLRDSARHLEWLKTVKESHGSVELSSLSLATSINSKGVYIIKAPKEGQEVSLDAVLTLTLTESHADVEEVRHYSLEELKELLNKLMLMSGKGDQSNVEVERFSEVFCNVQRLAQAFINLHSSGNLLFRAWTAAVTCSPSSSSSSSSSPRSEARVLMDFRLEAVGRLSGRGEAGEMLAALCRQMERFLDQWQRVVAQKRATHFYLNYYSAEQLVYLGRELGEGSPAEAALTMLSFIKGDCSQGDLLEAASRRAPAAAAGRPAGPPRAPDSEADLGTELRAAWEAHLAEAGAFFPGHLDLDALGLRLAGLAALAGPPVLRDLPGGLRAGRPNLVVCPPAEVLASALAVYMESPGQPLPAYDEVLLCSAATGFEEAALVLRRCLTPGYGGRKVYSLVHADQLSYDVSCRLEELFQRLSGQPHRPDYRLVLVCSAERDHCYIPSAFSQYKVLVTPQRPARDIRDYLARHLHAPEAWSAARVFQGQMCVGFVTSQRAGVGKSLYVKRLHEKLQDKFPGQDVPLKTIRLIERQVDESKVLQSLLPFLDAKHQKNAMIFHLDVTSSVQSGVWELLFKLLVLRHLMDTNGKMWLRRRRHLYVIEILEVPPATPEGPSKPTPPGPRFSFLDAFPKVTCLAPKRVLEMYAETGGPPSPSTPGMDPREFVSEPFQRASQYLRRFDRRQDLDGFRYAAGSVEGTPAECLQHLLLHCGVTDPSWAELGNFTRFLNVQLRDCEASVFCDPQFVGDTLVGFKHFVVTFMILMARDFATPSLTTSDQSPGGRAPAPAGVPEEEEEEEEEEEAGPAPFSLRKKWESEPHPYLFFNGDRTSVTFLGFHLRENPAGGVDALSPSTGRVIKRNVMSRELHGGLRHQKVPFDVDFDALPRHEKLERLCTALGLQWALDPDETYELTADNVLKMLAVEMRFRCEIPVIVMGETGCGKTRLIRFLTELRRGGADAETLRLVKVHGGTGAAQIHARVREAEAAALANRARHGLDTVLFFDEANATEAVGCIKEVLCDRTVDGRPLAPDSGLRVVAACNPYRRHSPEAVRRLEAAGLGYRVRAAETRDRLGSVPLRQLVYRVHALPPGLIPLVWDFGQLDDATEGRYVRQMVQRLTRGAGLAPAGLRVVAEALAASQSHLRRRGGECGFVSLRDAERCVTVFRWFLEHSAWLLGPPAAGRPDPVLWALVLALAVCYQASLEERAPYWEAICPLLGPGPLREGRAVLAEIGRVQDLLLGGVPLRGNIARNRALKENVFMMVVCIELKIPLFLVGKPGSSKSLAKAIVAEAMQGRAAPTAPFRRLKQAHLVSFQCSPHSTPQGIVGAFRQCARFQRGKDLRDYVAVVVLDEVGLAEDSPRMALKALHPLLEDGCLDDAPAPHKKVGFVGISNWALDPAKMNRGLFVARGTPGQEELVDSARGICASDALTQERVRGCFAAFADGYQAVCRAQGKEFFGLRDFYGLVKMVFAAARASGRPPGPGDVARAVLRNFSGRDDVDALALFGAWPPGARRPEELAPLRLVGQNLSGDAEDPEGRYLLVLTRNYTALQILQQAFFREGRRPEVVFGSGFPRDQEYARVCRDINRVKVCMETGRAVVLLNLHSLYESLYDALNQYYVHLGGQKYVDLGLGTHRVKCRVHPRFRLVVVEEKEVVYARFPVPLINRLEKHYLDLSTVLDGRHRAAAEELEDWAARFAALRPGAAPARPGYGPPDVFVGYHSDTCASVVLQVAGRRGREDGARGAAGLAQEARLVLLHCATPDAVIRLPASKLDSQSARALAEEYFRRQRHGSLADFLRAHLRGMAAGRPAAFTEVTTFSRLLTGVDADSLQAEIGDRAQRPRILSLQQFDTEYSFLKEIRNFLNPPDGNKILIIQTDFEDGSQSAQLIASAKYSVVNEINKAELTGGCISVYFITKLSRAESGTSYVGFHGGLWQCVHIDDLRRPTFMVSDVTALQNISISQLFSQQDDESQEAAPEAESGSAAGMETEPEGGREAEMEVEDENPMEVSEEKMEEEPSETRRSHVEVLDTTNLLRSCVQSAVGMLREEEGTPSRSPRRLEVLLGLLAEEDGRQAPFLRVAKARLSSLLSKQEEKIYHYNVKEWVAREACNQEALQEAGTFRYSLWKRVQNTVTPVLASVVAFVDRDCNLDLLVSPESPPWVRSLWMFIFGNTKLLVIPPVAISGGSPPSRAPLLVQNDMRLPENVSNSVPFSWRIKEYLEELWVQAQYISSAEGSAEKFVDIFQQTPLGKFISQLSEEERQSLLHRYLRDFLLLTMRVATWDELQFLRLALSSGLEQLKAAKSPAVEEVSLPWVHLAYQHFRSRLQNFSRILAVHPPVLDALKRAEDSYDLNSSEMAVDVCAALACAEMLRDGVLKPSPKAWLQVVKNLRMPIELACSESHLQDAGKLCRILLQKIKNQWNQVFSMALFVEHVLLGTEAQIPNLQELVKNYVSLLGKCLEDNADIKTLKPFAAVIATLCRCKETVSQTYFRYGLVPCPICLGDPKEPVCLPCDHVFCQQCITQWLIPGQMNCPYCLTDLLHGFSVTVSKEHRAAFTKHAQFRQMCNSFFIDLVSSMCFKDNTPPEKKVIEELLSLLFVHKKLLRTVPQASTQYTKSLSPFDDVVDQTPVIRSVVLKLLLKYSFHNVKEYLQEYLSQIEKKPFLDTDKTELYSLFINCLEDSIVEKAGSCSPSGGGSGGGDDGLNNLKEEGHFLRICSPLQQEATGVVTEASVEYLQGVARIRLCLARAADLLFEQHQDPELSREKQSYLQEVKRFCLEAPSDWYQVYLVRKLTDQFGMEFAQSLGGEPRFQWVFPQEILQQQKDQPGQMDRYLVCGNNYKALRDALGKALIKCDVEIIVKAQEACDSCGTEQAVYLLLAIFQELTLLYKSPNPSVHPRAEQLETVTRFIEGAQVLAPPDVQKVAKSLVTNTFQSLPVSPADSSHRGRVTELAVHAAAVLLCGSNPVLAPLRNLAFTPAAMQDSFLPTMPEDLLAQALTWQWNGNVRWFRCSNGHPCMVGECGAPMERSRCVDCGVTVGGENHKADQGFQLVQNDTDRTQKGHVLGSPHCRETAAVGDRELAPVVFVLLRLLTHLAMLLGISRSPQSLLTMIKPRVQDAGSFLLQHIQKDLEQLTKTLGKSADDTVNVVHLVLGGLLKTPRPVLGHEPLGFDPTLSTKERRNRWEKVVAGLMVPQLKNLDEALREVNRRISRDERITSNLVAKMVYGDPTPFLSRLPRPSTVHCSRIWTCRKKVSVDHLRHVVEQRDGRDTVPILWHFLQKEGELRLVKFLPEILALQRDLVKRFQNASDVDFHTIRVFLNSHRSDGMRCLIQERVEIFLSTWNHLRQSIDTNGEIKLPKGYCDAALTLDSEFEVLLPRRRGLGLCSTALVSYLIGLHNHFIYTVEKYTKESNSYSVSPSEVTDLHVISYEVERDLIPLILANCQYSVEKGGETLQEFDLEKIQRQATGRFFQGKPHLTLKGIPTLVYRHDRNYERLFLDIKNKMPQTSLPNSVTNAIGGHLQSYSDVCEALSVTEITLGFLGTAGGDPNMLLIPYVQDVLRMGDQMGSPVLKALSRCHLKHTIALWQFLSSHKSEQLLRLKKDPFGEISEAYKAELSAGNTQLLKAFLNQAGLEAFLQELHEMIVLKLKHAQEEGEFNPEWGLGDTLVSYIETKESDIPPRLESSFPGEILLSHCVAVWKATAALKLDRRLR
ncbi:E3 ubiquitin-protein ligase RNF213 [Tachyglossus aculeatus]|uniref:E3 ubiquitin-protein ligase RNF213 n=1 Tax=Tachyglossus aculeatus TaxID=9261 RepID=UPI0018F596B1|nr:E3 ubiquitin-protein ligase RNF213 [Tachyglossus aculeatus]